MKLIAAQESVVLRAGVMRALALIVCACIQTPVLAEGSKLGAIDLWLSTDDASPALNGPSLLRPPVSWSWDAPAPALDFAAGIGHRFLGRLSLDAGVSVAHIPEYTSNTVSGSPDGTINYRDYFFGLRYGALDGKVWYLPEAHFGDEASAMYYEAGWAQPVTDNLSLSVRLGQYDGNSSNRLFGAHDMPSLSLGASTTLEGYGVGLRLIDGGGHIFGGEQDLQLMGSISKPLH